VAKEITKWLFLLVQHLQMADLMTFWLASLPITCQLGEGENPRRRESIGNQTHVPKIIFRVCKHPSAKPITMILPV
jgi:hypothetical protein